MPRRAAWLLHTTLAPWNNAAAAPSPAAAVTSQQAELTPRECEVLQLAAQGLRDREIATHLCVSTRTVQHHLSSCYSKLGVRGRAEAVQSARRESPADAALAAFAL